MKHKILILLLLLISTVSYADTDTVSLIHEIAIENDVDPCLAEAVARLESGHFKKHKYNNLYGIMQRKGDKYVPRRYDSQNDSIKAFCDLINSNSYKGKTIDEIARIYCPGEWEHWARSVKSLMSEYSSDK